MNIGKGLEKLIPTKSKNLAKLPILNYKTSMLNIGDIKDPLRGDEYKVLLWAQEYGLDKFILDKTYEYLIPENLRKYFTWEEQPISVVNPMALDWRIAQVQYARENPPSPSFLQHSWAEAIDYITSAAIALGWKPSQFTP